MMFSTGQPKLPAAIASCSGLTDEGLARLVAGSPELRRVDLSECAVGALALAALGQGCRHLTELVLEGCDDVDDTGLAQVAAGCPGLLAIDLRECEQVTDRGIDAVARGCATASV